MSLTTALFTGLTGLDVNTKAMDVIGNNITNANTIGFKASRAVFESQLSTSVTNGSAPSANSGGTNPTQVGLGVQFTGTQRTFKDGSVQTTGNATDLAIEGQGLFILRQNGEQVFTRSGTFSLDSVHNLVSVGGGIVQGFGVDDSFNVVPGPLKDINIPLGSLTVAQATRNVNFAGNLNASGTVATAGSKTTSQPLLDLANGGAPATGTTLLTDLTADGVTPLFAAGNIVTMQGVEKGGKSLTTSTFEINATNTTQSSDNGTTLQDYMDFLSDVTGLDPAVDGAGVTVDGAGVVTIAGNFGTVNGINIKSADILSSGSPSQPLQWTNTQSATGESVRTTFVAFDSIGTPVTVDISAVLTTRDTSGTSWRLYAESPDDTDLSLSLGTNTITFDTFGQLKNGGTAAISIDRLNTGAVNPMSINLDFAATKNFSSISDTSSTMAATFQDGSPIGHLTSFSIGDTGVINGSFSNGLTRTLGQIALGTFSNEAGLVDGGGNVFRSGPNSGLAVNVSPLSFGSGKIIAGALELSNTDLSQEFVNLISATTGFSASSKLITTADQLVQQLLQLTR
jgi:flagellar hook protein FlgE